MCALETGRNQQSVSSKRGIQITIISDELHNFVKYRKYREVRCFQQSSCKQVS